MKSEWISLQGVAWRGRRGGKGRWYTCLLLSPGSLPGGFRAQWRTANAIVAGKSPYAAPISAS